MTTTTTHHAIGTRVSYEDMANPLSCGTVTSVLTDRFGTFYTVTWDQDSVRAQFSLMTETDLRQRGWTVL